MSREEEELLLLLLLAACCNGIYYYAVKINLRRRNRLIWVKPWLKCRAEKSMYHNIVAELRCHDRYDYRKYFRMNAETFEVSKRNFVFTTRPRVLWL